MGATVVLTLAGLEIWLRAKGGVTVTTVTLPSVADPASVLYRETPRGRRLIPDSHVVLKLLKREIRMDVNALGFRGPEVAAEKAPGEVRILVLGDSVTFGARLAQEETWVDRAGVEARRRLPGVRVTMINGGVEDVGIREEVDILEESGLAAKPDVVLLAFYLNDSRPPWGFAGELGSRGWLRRHSVLAETVAMSLHVRRWLRETGTERFAWVKETSRLPWATEPPALRELARLASHDWGAAWNDGSWSVVERELSRLEELARRAGARVAVVAFPVKYQVAASFVDDAPQRRMEALAAGRGHPYHDLLPFLRSHAGEELFFDQCHPRPAAAALIGAEVGAFLAEEVVPLVTEGAAHAAR